LQLHQELATLPDRYAPLLLVNHLVLPSSTAPVRLAQGRVRALRSRTCSHCPGSRRYSRYPSRSHNRNRSPHASPWKPTRCRFPDRNSRNCTPSAALAAPAPWSCRTPFVSIPSRSPANVRAGPRGRVKFEPSSALGDGPRRR
jgi:hypothetical protein